MNLPISPKKLYSVWAAIFLAAQGIVILQIAAEEIAISGNSRNTLSIEIPVINGAWAKIEASCDLNSWNTYADPLFDLTEFKIDPIEKNSLFFRFVLYPAPQPPYTVAVIGDSTAAGVIHGEEIVSGGWAEGMRIYAGLDTRILNGGEPGLSSKSFLGDRRRRLDTLIRTEPEFVFIQFGQIDEISKSDLRMTTILDYKENLKTIVESVREWNGIPILVTPLPWRIFSPDGTTSAILRDRSDAVLSVAREVGTLVIDFHAILSTYYPSLTSEELSSLSAVDHYHFSVKGAEVGAGLLIEALPAHLRELLFVSEPQ